MRALVIMTLALSAACGTNPTDAPPTSKPVLTSDGAPARFIAVTDDGSIVVGKTADGSIERVLLLREGAQERILHLAFDGAREELYFSESSPRTSCAQIRRLRVKQAEVSFFSEGWRQEISPDNQRLAWTNNSCKSDPRIRVARLDTVSTQTWNLATHAASLGRLGWGWDSTTLYVGLCQETNTCTPAQMNSSTAEDTVRPVPGPTEVDGEEIEWAKIVRGSDELIVSIEYLFVDFDGPELDLPDPIYLVNPRDGSVTTLIEDLDGYLLDADTSGRHLLFETGHKLFRWYAGTMTEIGGTFATAVWYD